MEDPPKSLDRLSSCITFVDQSVRQSGAMAFLPCHVRRTFRFSRAGLNHATVSRSGWTFVRGSGTQLPVVERKPLVLKASQFQHLFEEGPTEKVYADTPVSGLGQAQQGKILQEWARKVLQEKNPETEILDPGPGTCCNGRRRGPHQAEYDFSMGGRRVEVKSSRMAWSSKDGRWNVQFFHVKLAYQERAEPAFDDLYLVLSSPRGLHLVKHDLATGVSTRGKSTEISGHIVQVRGSTTTDCWEDALDDILEKLCERGGCTVVHEQRFSDSEFKEMLSNGVSPGQAAVAGLPMSNMSREKRGNRIQEIGLAIDRVLHPGSKFSFMKGNCGAANAPADWVRGKTRVELKSCGLTFDQSTNRWRCRFAWLKPGLFDELWLAVYTAAGIRYYRSKPGNSHSLVFARAGVATTIDGHQLQYYGCCGELDPLEAFNAIEAKIISRGCELIAIVEWEKGASMQDASPTIDSL